MATKLSERTIKMIQATVPVLEQYGEEITRRFYELMFENHPELLNVFNHAHQKLGQQPKALAASVYAAAKHIDNLETILPVVMKIGHKHRSVGVKKEHYPIVGKHLLLAMKDVLGDAATDDVIEAWKEAYGVIADVFIQVEQQMYDEAEQKRGGWKNFRPFVVQKKVKESDIITSFYLVPQDGGEISDFLPGQYVSVKVNIPGDTYTHIRQYSLSDAPNEPYYRISVKREDETNDRPAGVVSNYLHNDVKEGDVLELTAPAGDFVIDREKETPVLFVSGGVGITPLLSMAKTVVSEQPHRQVVFVCAAMNGRVQAFDEELRALAKRENVSYYVCYEKPSDEDKHHPHFKKEGFVDADMIKDVLPAGDVDVYMCGPIPFMKAVYEACEQCGVNEARIHYEFFGPASEL